MPARGLGRRYNGYTWIPRSWRYGIMLRDVDPKILARALQDPSNPDIPLLVGSLRCLWCLKTGVRLCLDHLTPWVRGGGDHPTNLVTSCFRCNLGRGSDDWVEWVENGPIDQHVYERIEFFRRVPVTPELRKVGMKVLRHSGSKPWRLPVMCEDRRRQDEALRRTLEPSYVHPDVTAALTAPDYVSEEPTQPEVPF